MATPYIIEHETTIPETTGASQTVPVPDGHESGDLILFFAHNDNNASTAIAVAGYTSAYTQSSSQTIRNAAFYKIAASSSEADITVTGANAHWVFHVTIIRNFDPSNIIDATSVVDSPNSTQNYLDITTFNTNYDNSLVMRYVGWDGTQSRINFDDVNGVVFLGKEISNSASIAGYQYQETAGATPALKVIAPTTTEGGQAVSIAIKGLTPSTPTPSPYHSKTYDTVHYFGDMGTQQDGITYETFTNVAATTIDGVAPYTFTEVISTYTDAATPWATMSSLSASGSAIDSTGRWAGVTWTHSAKDFTGKVYAVQMRINTVLHTGSKGVIIYFQDSSNNWAAFLVTKTVGMPAAISFEHVVDPENGEKLDSGGTIDWTDIVRTGYAYHRVGVTTQARVLYFRTAVTIDNIILHGGHVDQPLTPFFLGKAMTGWGNIDLGYGKGSGQAGTVGSLQYGDGSRPMYLLSKGTSLEFPRAYDKDKILSRYWNVGASTQQISVYAHADNTARFGSGVNATDTRQDFGIHASSSTSATYNFTGGTFVGYDITGKTGISFNGASFTSCYGINLNGGTLTNATVENSLSTPAVTTTDLGEISNTDFTSAGTGHAITITTAGTYDFFGNTFSGYGADTTTDAAIYNNSGGLVTITLADSDPTPTYRNGAGATTTIVSAVDNQSVTISGAVAGSRIQIYDLTSSTELYQGTPTFPYTWTDTNPYAADREIRLRVAYVSGVTAKLFIDTTIGTSTSATPALAYLVNQEDDTVYNANAVNGSTITTVTIDDGALLVNVNTGSISWATIYAYNTYWLFTSAGIIDEGSAIIATDTANYVGQGFKIKNVTTSPTVPLSITGGWGVDATTGVPTDLFDTTGGSIFQVPDHVVPFATGSGVTPSDVTDIAEAVQSSARDYYQDGNYITPL